MEEPRSVISEYLLHLPEHRVLICRLCKHALRPGNGTERHLRSVHKKTIDLPTRKALVNYATELHLVEPNHVPCPNRGSHPVKGLSVMDGWECDTCGYTCASEVNMEKHCNSEHGWIKADGRRWQEQSVQTFFKSDECKYFVVIKPMEGEREGVGTIDHFITAMLEEAKGKDAEEDERLDVVDTDQHMVDKSPWMRRTGWLREFARKDMMTMVKKSW